LPANFDNISVITDGEWKGYHNESVGVMGPWNVHGQVYLVHSGSSDINIGSSSPYPYGLIYGCLLQTGAPGHLFPYDIPTTYIERTFNNVSGTSFYVSFWITLRSEHSAFTPPSTFKVYLNSEMVYSGPPTSYVWELMNTTTFITNGTNLTLRFEITKTDSVDRGLGINGIIIHPSATAQPTSWSQGSIQPSAQPSSQPSKFLTSQYSEGKFLTII
jgi:hypothetical protein